MNPEEELIASDQPQVTAEMIEDFEKEQLLNQPQTVESEVIQQGSFPAPYQSDIGNSTVDLSIPANQQNMKKEYDEWWNLGRTRFAGIFPYNQSEFQEQRNGLKDKWYQKYHGMPYAEFLEAKQANAKTIYGHSPDLQGWAKQMDNNFQGLSVPGLAYADFTNDALGTLVPGYGKLDDRWDEATQLDNPVYQNLRRILSIVLPAIHTGGKTNQLLAQSKAVQSMPFLQKTLTQIGAYGLADSLVTVLSDTSEDHNTARTLSDMVPGLFGPKGWTPLPEAWKTKDSHSPAMRKVMNFYENLGLSTFGTILGAAINSRSSIKKATDFMEPLEPSAAKYKQLELLKDSEAEDLIEYQRIQTLLSQGNLSTGTERQLLDGLFEIEERLGMTPIGVEEALKRRELAVNAEVNAAGRRKATTNPDQLELELDGDITPGLLDESSSVKNAPPPANVARNMADTTAIKNGDAVGDPAPIMTEAMREKGLMVGNKSRDAVMGVAEETRDIGRFNAVVDGIRYSAKQMNAAAWDIYTSIIAAENIDDVRALFLDNRDVRNFLMGRFKVETLNEEQARAAAFALRDLTDRFLGREVSEASARVMDTLGRESATLAESIQQGAPYVDENKAMDLIIEKMQFLLDEYGLNKYLSGWSLRNKNWFDQVPPKELDEVIETLTKEFTDAENAIHARNLRFTETLKEIKKTKPHFLRPLVDAYAHTNGDVDTLAKLNKWAQSQISPLTFIKSPDPKQMSLFAKATWSIVMNNVLSGLSAIRATVGNTYALTVKPITQVLGHGFWGVADSDFTGLKMTFYANGAMYETNRRAINDAFQMMKKAHKDPDMMMKAYRKDFQLQDAKEWDIMDSMREAWELEGDWGHMVQHDVVEKMRDLGRHPAMRYGMTGLVFPDAYASTMLAHYLSRVRAYDDVFTEFGYFKADAMAVAEAKHYKNFFDANGLIKDDVLRSIAGEVQLNLDDGLASWLNKGTTAYPVTKFLMMFPRTSSNAIKMGASWTPLSLIPGFNRYSKTIYARTDDQIAKALAEHGIDMATTPNARAIFKNLRAEYTGRLAFSGLLVGSLWQYAMAGNIRGNGHYNASRRNKERDQLGYDPLTINIGGKWVNYRDTPLRYILGPLGDMAYYAKDLNEPTLANWQSKLTWTIAASFLNDSPLQGFEPLVAITNGDLSGYNRLVANSTRAMLPLSGGAGVLANAISSSQKDLEGEIREYLANRLPGFNHNLPEQIDIWTGDPLNDVDQPFLRILNALSPIKVSGTAEPWRKWLQEIQWDGLSRLRKDSTGSYEYSAAEREIIYKYIGEQQIWKKLKPLMKSKRYNEQIEFLRNHRSTQADLVGEDMKLKKSLLPVYSEINRIVKEAQIIAEQRLAEEQPKIQESIYTQQILNNQMKEGDVEGAAAYQKRQLDKQKLLQFGGTR